MQNKKGATCECLDNVAGSWLEMNVKWQHFQILLVTLFKRQHWNGTKMQAKSECSTRMHTSPSITVNVIGLTLVLNKDFLSL